MILYFPHSQGYQFWTKADSEGYFSINDIRTGDYNLCAWVPGYIGDYQYDVVITITEGVIFLVLTNHFHAYMIFVVLTL